MDERKITSKSTQEILETIVQLADILDTEALYQIADVPFLELAKAISVGKAGCEDRKASFKGRSRRAMSVKL